MRTDNARPLLAAFPGPHHATSPEETYALGERIGARLADAFPEGAVVLLIGPLGAGKTVLAKGIAGGLGIAEPVVSPTYTIIAQYFGGRAPLHHVDLYRIEGREQIENLGLEDILRGSGIVLVEWGEKIEPWLDPPAAMRVFLSFAPDGGRDIRVEVMAA